MLSRNQKEPTDVLLARLLRSTFSMNKSKHSDVKTSLSDQIYFVRGHQVMLDHDLATLYSVTTKRLNEQLKRNQDRFPPDFAFQLTYQEVTNLRSQIATSSSEDEHGGRRYLPWAFTEHGVAMLSGILKSPTAIEVNILIIREFIRLRAVLNSNSEFENRLSELESSCDTQFKIAFDAIRQLMAERSSSRKRVIGLADY